MEENEIIVKQSVLINGLLLGFFTLILVGLYFTFMNDEEHSFSLYIKPIVGILCFVIFAYVNMKRRKEVYKINSFGLYYYGNLVTDWSNFYTAYVDDDSRGVSVTDDIRLVIQYYDEDAKLMEKRLPAPDNLDHSVYDLIEAIDKNRQALYSAKE